MASIQDSIQRKLVNLGFSDEFIHKSFPNLNESSSDLSEIKKNAFKTSHSADNIYLEKDNEVRKRSREIREYEDIYNDISFNVNEIDSNYELQFKSIFNLNTNLELNEEKDNTLNQIIAKESKFIETNFDSEQQKYIQKLQKLVNSNVLNDNKFTKVSSSQALLNDKKHDDEKFAIKKYNSRLKTKKWDIYVRNSNLINFNNEFKFYHQCNFPTCKRTFSTSGWLKKHLEEHLENEIYKDPLNEQFKQFNINIY